MNDTKKSYDVAVFVLRGEPVHIGHEEILKRCKDLADNVIVILGSSTASRSVRNPFTFRERESMLIAAIDGIDLNPTQITNWFIRGIADSAYNFHDWLTRVKALVNTVVDRDALRPAKDLIAKLPPKIAIVGHYKDDTSYYLDYFPEWDFVKIGSLYDGMQTQLSPDDLMFLARFRTSPDMQRFRMILDKELSSVDDKSRHLDGPALYRLQGVGIWLVDLFSTIDKAAATLAGKPVDRFHQPYRTVSAPAEQSGATF